MTPSIVLRGALAALLVGALAVGTAACRGETSAQPPLMPERNMYQQQRNNPQARSGFFEDGRTMRKPVPHSFAREMIVESEIAEGELPDGSGYVLTVPDAMVADLGGMAKAVARGQERYDVFCTPCHDATGAGQGLVVKRGMTQPPSLHDARIRHMPDGQLFATIGNGVRTMPAYSYSIPTADRWAIVSYVRALEVSQAGEQ